MKQMKRQRPSLDTSFGSPSLQRAPQVLFDATRTRANSAASQSSSSAFATPPEGSSPRQSHAQSGIVANSSAQGIPNPSKATDITPTYTSTHNRTASVGSPPLFEFVKAKYDYSPDHPSGLPFYAGQIIRVHYKDQSGWWDGECGNVRGWFPSNYLLENSSRFVRAMSQVSDIIFSLFLFFSLHPIRRKRQWSAFSYCLPKSFDDRCVRPWMARPSQWLGSTSHWETSRSCLL